MPDEGFRQTSGNRDISQPSNPTHLLAVGNATRQRRHRQSFNYDDERLIQTPPESPATFSGTFFGGEESGQEYSPNTQHEISNNGLNGSEARSKTGVGTMRWLAKRHGIENSTFMYAVETPPLFGLGVDQSKQHRNEHALIMTGISVTTFRLSDGSSNTNGAIL